MNPMDGISTAFRPDKNGKTLEVRPKLYARFRAKGEQGKLMVRCWKRKLR